VSPPLKFSLTFHVVRLDFDAVDFQLDPFPSGLWAVGRLEAKPPAEEPQRNHAPYEQQEDEEQSSHDLCPRLDGGLTGPSIGSGGRERDHFLTKLSGVVATN
jgi:hypothetical protein